MTTSEPTPEEVEQVVAEMVAAIHGGWTPDLELRLRFGLTEELLAQIRSLPPEVDINED